MTIRYLTTQSSSETHPAKNDVDEATSLFCAAAAQSVVFRVSFALSNGELHFLEPIRYEDDEVVFDTHAMAPERFYPFEFEGHTLLAVKRGDDSLEVFRFGVGGDVDRSL